MRMARLLTGALLAPLICALFASAAAAEIVPPGNSAASQYTEAFPTPGGERETDDREKGRAVPGKALGAGNAKRLESKGEDGKAAAEFAAETAPASAAPSSQDGDSGSGGGDDAGQQAGGGGATGGGGSGSGGDGAGEGSSGAANAGNVTAVAAGGAAGEPSGSSGFSEVLGSATGSSSGELGWLLPLIVIGAVVWSLIYLWRQRQRVA
jgi:hypothetical protein